MEFDELEKLGDFAGVMDALPPELKADKEERATIDSFVRKLPRDGILRRAAERILRDTAGEPDTVPTLRTAVVERSGFRWRERVVAAWCLGLTRIPSEKEREDIRSSLGAVANQSLERDNFGAFVRLQWRALIITFPVFLITMKLGGRNEPTWMIPLNLLFMNLAFSILALPVSTMLERRRMNLARAASVLSLGRMAAPEATGVVAAAVYDKVGEGSAEVKKAAERALPSVLGALSSEHYGRVRNTSIDYLCRILLDRRHHLVIAALDALEKVGGGSAVDSVARLTKRARWPDVRSRAERVLLILEARRRDEKAPALLLRATTGSPPDGDALLRPVAIEQETDPLLLLRPTSGDSDS